MCMVQSFIDKSFDKDPHNARGYILVVGGSPEPSSAQLVGLLAKKAFAIVAVDRGLDMLLAEGLGCDLFCGDADTVGAQGAACVQACEDGRASAVGSVEHYNPHKDDTDLGLALRAIAERWGDAPLVCTCFSGGAPDHALGVYGRLAAFNAQALYLVEDGFVARLLHAGDAFELGSFVGKRVSCMPLSAEADVSECGMRWNLDHECMLFLSDLGISNVVEQKDARITCHTGILAVWVFDQS